MPTVSCEESQAFQALPDFPEIPDVPATTDGQTEQSVKENYEKLYKFSTEDSPQWAVSVAGVYMYNSILRDSTSECISKLRESGIIN